MSLEIHAIDATGTNIELGAVRLGTSAFTTAAEQGTMAQGTIDIPDKGGVLRLAGLKRIWAYEPDSPVNWQTFWVGFLGSRQIHRGDGDLLIGSDRVITADMFDLNELLNDVLIKGAADASHGVRPAETDLERVAWLLQPTPSWFPTAGGVAEVHDLGFVATAGGVAMDACDYRGQTAQSVLQDCADKSGRNWFVYFDEVTDTYGLWYDKASSANYVCTLSFSNVDGDADSDTIWPMGPIPSPTQVQDPAKIVSGVRAPYTGGEVFRLDSDVGLTTSVDFYIREQTAPSANTKSSAVASAMADRLLKDNDEEEVSASFSVPLPSTHVGLVRAGMRVACRFEHFDPPYRDWAHWRILRLQTAQDEPNLGWYNLKLDVTPAAPTCECDGTLGTGVVPVGDWREMLLGPIYVPAHCTLTVVRYDWSEYTTEGQTPQCRIGAHWRDYTGGSPHSMSDVLYAEFANNRNGIKVTLGADYGARSTYFASPGSGMNLDPTDGPVASPDLGGGLSGMVFENISDVDFPILLHCSDNPYYESVGTFEITATYVCGDELA